MLTHIRRHIAILLTFLILAPCAVGAETADSVQPRRRGNIVSRIINYFNESNKPRDTSKLDFSFIGGPYYSSSMGVGVGLVASGLYGTGVNDSLIPPSNISFFGKFSTKGFVTIGIEGTHISPDDSYRINYMTEFFSDPSDYWGIGYEMGNNNADKSTLKRIGLKGNFEFLYHLGAHLYAGPMVAVDYIHAFDIERRELLDGQRTTLWSYGAGVTLTYDTRDVLTNPHSGVYASVTQSFRPAFIGNRYAFSTTDIQFDWYRTPWTGGIIAADVRGKFNFGNPPWNLMSLIGGSHFMRGYYEGRYRDKYMMAVQAELRQHVWRRNSLVAWVGAGTVFRRFNDITFGHLLPNWGVGYRWEFKKDVNVRLDVGFGKHGQNEFIFGINEAF